MPLLSMASGNARSRGHRVTVAAGYGYADASEQIDVDYVPLSTREEHEKVVRDKGIQPTRYCGLFTGRHSVRWNEIILAVIEKHRAPGLAVVSAERPNLWADLVARKHLCVGVVRAVIDLPQLPELIDTGLAGGRVQALLDARWNNNWARYLSVYRGINAGNNHASRIYRSARSSVPTIALWPDWIVDRSRLRGLRKAFGFMPVPGRPELDPRLRGAIASVSRGGHLVFVAGTEGTTRGWLPQFIEGQVKESAVRLEKKGYSWVAPGRWMNRGSAAI